MFAEHNRSKSHAHSDTSRYNRRSYCPKGDRKMDRRIDMFLVTTSTEIPGYRIVRNYGIVRGIIVRSRSILGSLGAALQTIVGGNITILTNLCEKTRGEAFELLLQHAAEQ